MQGPAIIRKNYSINNPKIPILGIIMMRIKTSSYILISPLHDSKRVPVYREVPTSWVIFNISVVAKLQLSDKYSDYLSKADSFA